LTTKPPPQKILKGILHIADENKHNLNRTGNIKLPEKNTQVIRE
jgi:hypothetical protein